MRNVFDQYEQPENRLTHALLSALHADRRLLRSFVREFAGEECPNSVEVYEQQMPNSRQISFRVSKHDTGIPDGCISDGVNWILLIECKVQARLEQSQLERHINTAKRYGFEKPKLLVIVLKSSQVDANFGYRSTTWKDVYGWLDSKPSGSEWPARCASYFEIFESQQADKYLTEGILTRFTGIPFNQNDPYTYSQAKRVLGLLRGELLKKKELKTHLRMDPKSEGRKAITGKSTTQIWDFISLKHARGAASFTQYPHLTLSILEDRLFAHVTIPNGVKSNIRQKLFGSSFEEFEKRTEQTTRDLFKRLKHYKGWRPRMGVMQRHYLSQRSTPIIDADLQFDPRTAVSLHKFERGGIKPQKEWLGAMHAVMRHRKSNMQFVFGVEFPFDDECKVTRTPEIVDAVANTWNACKPFLVISDRG